MKRGSTAKQGECGYESYESQAMVTVKVGYEYVVDVRELDVALAELHLHSLGTINHEQFLTDVDYL